MSYDEAVRELEQVDGVLVPGGFGSRGWEGKILACRVAREREIPYLGIWSFASDLNDIAG